jgi:hypothetical protein
VVTRVFKNNVSSVWKTVWTVAVSFRRLKFTGIVTADAVEASAQNARRPRALALHHAMSFISFSLGEGSLPWVVRSTREVSVAVPAPPGLL